MKSKLFLCLTALSFLVLTGCNNNTPAPHTHEYDKENVEWQWNEQPSGGYNAKAIFSCLSCDEDTEGHYLEVEATVTSRVSKEATCESAGTTLYTATAMFEGLVYNANKEKPFYDENAHHFVEIVDEAYLKSEATCTEDAVYYKSCEYCHKKSEDTFVATNSKLGHHLVHHSASESTCQIQGNIEYYECDRCNKLFLDESAANETTLNDVLLPLAHHYIEVVDEAYLKSPATCTEDAIYYKICEFCQEKTEETFVLNDSKLGHNLTHHVAKESTCQVNGNIEYYECERCHKLYLNEEATEETDLDNVTLPLAHKMTHHDGVDPTCTQEGSHDYYTCEYEEGVKYKNEDGKEKYNNDSELVIPKLGHTFDDNFKCIRCDHTLKEELSLEDASGMDGMPSVTISNIGLNSGVVIPNGTSHLWGNYDYVTNKGIDLWIKLAYPTPEKATDYYSLFYLFSDGAEGGIAFRFGLSRFEDDGIVPCYVFTQNDYSANPGTTVVRTAGSEGTIFWLPRSSGVKSSTNNLLHLSAYCLDEATNLFRCSFTVGVEGGTQWNLSTNPEDKENAPKTFDICLGENYFNNGSGRKVRLSCNALDRATVYDVVNEESTLIYKGVDGSVAGKLSNVGTAKLPALVANNKTFLGWFDPQGNRINDGDTISVKTIVTPRFVNNQTNMFVPSSVIEFAAAKGGWFESIAFTGEAGGQLPVSEISDGYDLYFIYHFVSKSSNDNYAIFGFPFDFIDAQTRIDIRIDNKENGNLVGYIYGNTTNLGAAGADGTMFTEAGFRANNADLLIHMAVSNASGAGLTLLVEIINLGDGQAYQITREVTFNDATLYSLNDPARNIFDLMKANCEYRITDAF